MGDVRVPVGPIQHPISQFHSHVHSIWHSPPLHVTHHPFIQALHRHLQLHLILSSPGTEILNSMDWLALLPPFSPPFSSHAFFSRSPISFSPSLSVSSTFSHPFYLFCCPILQDSFPAPMKTPSIVSSRLWMLTGKKSFDFVTTLRKFIWCEPSKECVC